MLTRILHNSSELCEFIKMLELKLSKPQQRHIINVVDGLIVTETSKTLAEIQRQYVSCVDPSNIADTFRIAPWKTDEIRQPLVEFLMKTALKYLDGRGYGPTQPLLGPCTPGSVS